jgi:hypothetical protein
MRARDWHDADPALRIAHACCESESCPKANGDLAWQTLPLGAEILSIGIAPIEPQRTSAIQVWQSQTARTPIHSDSECPSWVTTDKTQSGITGLLNHQ